MAILGKLLLAAITFLACHSIADVRPGEPT